MKNGNIFLKIFATVSILICFAVAMSSCRKGPDNDGTPPATDVVIADSGESSYVIIYSQDSGKGGSFAYKLNSVLGAQLTARTDAAEEIKEEILIGETNRALSADLKAHVTKDTAEDSFVWGFAYRDGQFAFYFNNQTAFEKGLAEFKTKFMKDGDFVVSSDTWYKKELTRAEYTEELDKIADAEKEAQRNAKKQELLEIQAKFTQAQFGEYKSMIGPTGYLKESPYEAPLVYPVKGQHPRLVINASDIPTIKNLLEDPEYGELAENFWMLADGDCEYGIFKDTAHPSTGNIYRWNNGYLKMMVAKALAYLITGDELYALEAIVSIKNAMLTYLMIPEVDSDTYSGGSNVIYAASVVFDWCHDALTEEDKAQILAGIPNLCISTMEISYPPTNMSHVNGHGTGPQFLRDMMFMATAFYDEAPDWWELIAGRYFEQFLPVANETFGKGWVSQGTANYAYNKLAVQLKAALCIYTATGKNYLDSEANEGCYFLLSHAMPETGRYFETGDGGRTGSGNTRALREYGPYLIAAALYKDPTVFANAKALSHNFSDYSDSSITIPNPALTLGLIAVYMRSGTDTGEGRYDNVPLIQYFEHPAGQMTARDSWIRSDAAVAFMKIGTMTMVNHDTYDNGTFQIYYKGLLATSSGSYKKYGGYTHKYYLQATVSSNGILVFNPSKADDEPIYGTNSDGTVNKNVIKNAARYFYSGSQLVRSSEPSNYESLMGGDFYTAEITGASTGYFKNGDAEYGYIAGDLTRAYASDTVEFIERRMLTVYTGNTEFPMLFFTYDNITSTDASFEKTYLLHTVTEPTVDEDGLSAVIVNKDGKMHMQSLYGGKTISKIGGEGYAYWINGKNCVDEYNTSDNSETIWGRIELKTVGEKTSKMLTAIYVTDATNENTLNIDKFESETVHGAKADKVIVAFAKSDQLMYKDITFETSGEGNYRYYVSGVESGTWSVKVNGVDVDSVKVKAEEGMLSFTAPAGSVVLTPGIDVLGTSGGKIQYYTDGGVLPDDAPAVYREGVVTALPTQLKKENCTFVGWFTSPSFEAETLVTEVPEGTSGTFRVYARWINTYIDESFNTKDIYVTAKDETIGRLTLEGGSKPGSVFKTQTDANGVSYLLWVKGEKDPAIGVNGGSSGIHTSSTDDNCISFTLKLGKEADKPVPVLTARLIANVDVNGNTLSPTKKIEFLKTTADGSVQFMGESIMELSANKITTIRFVIDFNDLEIRVHDEDYNFIKSAKFTIPAETGATNGAELMKCFARRIFHLYASTGEGDTGCAIRFYGIKIEDSDTITPNVPKLTNPIVYELDGGSLPDGAPKKFSETESVTLPTPTKSNSVFLGWYTTPDFESSSLITVIPPTVADEFKVYAKWFTVILDEDYSESVVDLYEKSKKVNGTDYSASSKTAASFKTKTDGNDKNYLEWIKGENDPAMVIRGNDLNLTNTSSGEISFIFKFAKDGECAVSNLEANLVAGCTVTGDTLSPTAKINAFKVSDGKILLGNKVEVGVISEQIIELRFVIDFEDLEIRAYSEDGTVIGRVSFAIPEKTGATSGAELMKCFNTRILNIRAFGEDTNCSLRVYGFKIVAGDMFAE